MKSILLMKGSSGADVDALRVQLGALLARGGDAALPLGAKGEAISNDLDAAIRRWQAGIGVIADGIVGPRGRLLLGLDRPAPLQPPLDLAFVCLLFPATKPANIARYLPYVEAALGVAGLTDREVVLAALATIRAETEGFVPLAEFASKRNTVAGGAPFSAYERESDFDNATPGDGQRFRGRGFVQLRGRRAYREDGALIGLPLEANPDLANAPEVAAVLLALALASHADAIRKALARPDYAAARRLISGNVDGLERFRDVFTLAASPAGPKQAPAAKRARVAARAGATPASPATQAAAAAVARTTAKRTSKTKKDAVDLRDRPFIPSAISLPDDYPPVSEMQKFLPEYTRAKLVLDQGQEGACTGFGLACCINYLRWIKADLPATMESVSPRMLYTLARRYDEYAGENYEGSSCRGAIKGWFNHGVCLESDWPFGADHASPPAYGFAKSSAANTLGVYYRIDMAQIVDMQAAIAQHRAIFVSCFTHGGWDAIGRSAKVPKTHADLPVIAFDGHPSKADGHAFAIVGFNGSGFIVQNSWGADWGAGGFAVLGYFDWLANGMDAWVVALGVPGVVAGLLASGNADVVGRAGALGSASAWWDEGRAYRHSVVLGNDGRVARYLTEDEPSRKLQQQAFVLPDLWFRSQPALAQKRLVLYVHGGLNSEGDAIKRARAMGRFFLGNGCYPLFLVWKTGLLESIGDIVADAFHGRSQRAGASEWLSEKTDVIVEKTIGRPAARPIWSEMKENAGLAFEPRRGGDVLVDALETLAGTWGAQFELHVVGHSAGSIALGHLLSSLRARKPAALAPKALADFVTSAHLYAPACTVAFANQHYALDPVLMGKLFVDILSDKTERDDNVVQVYRKSLLYFVSNALEADLRTPILGMARTDDQNDAGWDGSSNTGEALALWREAASGAGLKQRTTWVTDSRITTAVTAEGPVLTQAAHGAFDNDITVVGRTLERITGAKLAIPVDDLRGF